MPCCRRVLTNIEFNNQLWVSMILRCQQSSDHWRHVAVAEGRPSGPQINECTWKLFFSFLNQNICCGYSKEPSQWDCSFEDPKHVLIAWQEKNCNFCTNKFCLTGPMDHFCMNFYFSVWWRGLYSENSRDEVTLIVISQHSKVCTFGPAHDSLRLWYFLHISKVSLDMCMHSSSMLVWANFYYSILCKEGQLMQ